MSDHHIAVTLPDPCQYYTVVLIVWQPLYSVPLILSTFLELGIITIMPIYRENKI